MLQKDKPQTKKSQNFKKRKLTKKLNKQRFSRFFSNTNIHYIAVFKECTLHLQHFIWLRKKIKKLKRIGFLLVKPKIWFTFNFNKILSRKGKNARMGKGRGDFSSWLVHLKKYSTVLKLYDVNSLSALSLANYLKTVTKFYFITK